MLASRRARIGLVATAAALLVGFGLPTAAQAADIPKPLLERAQAQPKRPFRVIVEGRGSGNAVYVRVQAMLAQLPGGQTGIDRRLSAVRGLSGRLPGAAIVALATDPEIASITPDAAVRAAELSSRQQWPWVSGVSRSWSGITSGWLTMPTIAIVDSGIDAGASISAVGWSSR